MYTSSLQGFYSSEVGIAQHKLDLPYSLATEDFSLGFKKSQPSDSSMMLPWLYFPYLGDTWNFEHHVQLARIHHLWIQNKEKIKRKIEAIAWVDNMSVVEE